LKDYLPDQKIIEERLPPNHDLIGYAAGKLFIKTNEGIGLYSLSDGKIRLVDLNRNVGNLLFFISRDTIIFGCNSSGEFFEFAYPMNDELQIKNRVKLGWIPTNINFDANKIYATMLKRSRLSSFIDPYYPTNYSRLVLWRAGWEIFKDYPLFGVGDIGLAKVYADYKPPYDKKIEGHLHSNYFHSLATLGAIGFIAIMFLFIKIFLVPLSLVKKLRQIPFASSFSLGAIGGYVSFLAAGLTEYNFGDHEVITMVWFTLALSIAFSRNVKTEYQNSQ
jgi:hypothetical protein